MGRSGDESRDRKVHKRDIGRNFSMGRIRPTEKTLLFVGALFSNPDYYLEAYKMLEESFGEIVMETPQMKWDFSDHYRDEMGEPIFRRFLFFRNLIQPDQLSKIKITTNDLEKQLSTGANRNINLDPGYLTLAKIVLASTKDYSHRVYLSDGIYAEVTLVFAKEQGIFVPNINTYNDYKDDRYIKFFSMARQLFPLLNR